MGPLVLTPLAVIAQIAYAGVDLSYAADDRLLPKGWATAQIIVPGIGGYIAALAAQQPSARAGAVVLAVTSTWFVEYGAWCLAEIAEAERHPRRRPHDTTRDSPPLRAHGAQTKLMLLPSHDGASVLASGWF